MANTVESKLLHDQQSGAPPNQSRKGGITSVPTVDPFASASLVPMLVGSLALIVIAMIVAVALS